MIDLTNSVGRKSENVHQINKSAGKGHPSEHYHDTNICRIILCPVPDTCALSSAENRLAAIQFHSSQHSVKMLSPESKHFKEQIVVK